MNRQNKPKFIIITFFILLSTFLLFSTPIYAHPGRTDSNGGHTDKSTGEYHYHHGYEAHQHINGKCPYDFDDKTDHSSSSSSSTSSVSNYQASSNDNSSKNNTFTFKPVYMILITLPFVILFFWFKNKCVTKIEDDPIITPPPQTDTEKDDATSNDSETSNKTRKNMDDYDHIYKEHLIILLQYAFAIIKQGTRDNSLNTPCQQNILHMLDTKINDLKPDITFIENHLELHKLANKTLYDITAALISEYQDYSSYYGEVQITLNIFITTLQNNVNFGMYSPEVASDILRFKVEHIYRIDNYYLNFSFKQTKSFA